MSDRANAILTIKVNYDPTQTSAPEIEQALDTLLENAKSTDGILDELGDTQIGGVSVAATDVALLAHRDSRMVDSEFIRSFRVPRNATAIEVQQLEDYAVLRQVLENAANI